MNALRFAIVGAGSIGEIHAAAIAAAPGARLTVVSSRGDARGRALAATHGAAWVADPFEAVARPEVDAVCVCTPSGAHETLATAAARAGKQVLVEKPLEITLPRVDRMIAAAREAGVTLGCVLPARYRPGSRAAKDAVAAGRLGRLTLVTATVKWHRPQAYYDEGGWRGTWDLDGGGALMNQAIHTIDLLHWLAGPADRVQGVTATLAHRMATEDTAAALLTLHGGAIGIIQAATSCWPGEPARLDLHGDRGTIALEDGRIVAWNLADADPEEQAAMRALEARGGSGASDPRAIGSERHRLVIEDFVSAVRAGRPPFVTGTDGRPAVELIRAIYASTATRQSVALPFDDAGEFPTS
jgi:predicted dehydrogenase